MQINFSSEIKSYPSTDLNNTHGLFLSEPIMAIGQLRITLGSRHAGVAIVILRYAEREV